MKNFIYAFSFLCFAANVFAQTPAIIPVKPDVVLVQGGTFIMGSKIRNNSEFCPETLHTVTVNTFSIGKFEVTVGQYWKYCNETGRSMPDAPEWDWQYEHPIVDVTYNEAVAYCNWLGEKFGGNWRLPTEAEWEYAASGGNKSLGSLYSGGNNLDSLAWFSLRYNRMLQTNSVGRKQPNELGIYDMSGNVREWCSDWWGEYYYQSSPSNNPQGPSSGDYRVIRGGCWFYFDTFCRVAGRDYEKPENRYRCNGCNGFRVVLSQ